MIFQNKLKTALVLLGALAVASSSHGEVSSACVKTNVGRPLKGLDFPKSPVNSNEVIEKLGPPFFAAKMEDKDVLVYVDGYFDGVKNVVKSTDEALSDLSTSSRSGCGVAYVFTFTEHRFSSWKMTALTLEDLAKAHASNFADTTWAAAPEK